MRKFKFLTVILSLMVFMGALSACNPDNSSSESSTPTHTCESVCEECGKCTNADCTEDVCEEKCEGHEPAPTHTCESVCPTCNKCTDADCTEEACADKCQGHEPAPTHTCESVCPTCNKCTDADCTEEACEDKCQGHTVEPEHTCESVCPTCGKCTDVDCTEAVCADKCQGHVVEPEHTCESKCPTCNKCTDADCQETVCADKCAGHTPAPVHTCESICPTCNKCTDADCTEEACEDKCQGHTVEPEHTCESVCPTCNKCTDADCTEDVCADKCAGHVHTCESVCELCGNCKDIDCTEEACEDKCPGHTVSEDWDTVEFNFMSFNINYSNSNSTQDVDETGWTQRKESVMSFINNSGAHVIGLQEIAEWKSDAQNQRLYFEQNLASKYQLVYFGDSSHKINIATIYDKTVFTLLSTELYWFSDTPDVPSNGWDGTNYRAASILILEHKATGEIVRAVNTHGPLSDAGNEKAFELIANRTLSDESSALTFLCGDFNATPNKLGYVPIAEKLQDCRVTAEESPNRDSRTWNGYSDTAKGILDYCFVSRNDNVKVLTYQVRDDKWGEGNYLSDHFAVQTTVRLYNNTESAWTKFY